MVRYLDVFPKSKSKLDFYGTLANGQSIYIEAKESKNPSIPLVNFKEHQFVYLEELRKFTEHTYVIIHMAKYNKVFLVKGEKIVEFNNKQERKSIPLSWLEENSEIVENMDFLKCIEDM